MQVLERTHRRPTRKPDTAVGGRLAETDQPDRPRGPDRIIEAGRAAIVRSLSDDPADFLKASRQLGAE
jgi:hypothetical protein